MQNLVGLSPEKLLSHGETKRLLTAYHLHEPKIGVVASYTPNQFDVQDHFGVFRGIDQIEAFAQATIVSCTTFLECQKLNCQLTDFKTKFLTAFISVGNVRFHQYLAMGETFISMGKITFYKFRQLVADGRIYKAPKGLDLDNYFKDFSEKN